MIWIFFFFLFLGMTLKDQIYLSELIILDCWSMFMISISPLVFLLVIFMAFSSFNSIEVSSYKFYFFILIFFVSLSFMSSNAFLFILNLELCVWPMMFLIYNFSKDEDKIHSLIFMFLINILGSLPFIIFYLSTLTLFDFSCSMSQLLQSFSKNYTFICFLLILVCKFPIFLTHFWLTKAHVSASGSCSMILASLMLKLGTFGLMKFISLFLTKSLNFLSIIISLSLLGSIMILIIMVRFFDVKNLIACSSILHMSMIFPLLVLESSLGVVGSLFMMTGHGLVSLILFYMISIVYEISLNRSFDANKSHESFSKTMILLMIFFLLLNLGIPPFVNFFSELYFMMVFCFYSFYTVIHFSLVMMIPIIFLMFFSVKFLFGKKIYFHYQDYSFKTFFFSTSYVGFLSLIPFLL